MGRARSVCSSRRAALWGPGPKEGPPPPLTSSSVCSGPGARGRAGPQPASPRRAEQTLGLRSQRPGRGPKHAMRARPMVRVGGGVSPCAIADTSVLPCAGPLTRATPVCRLGTQTLTEAASRVSVAQVYAERQACSALGYLQDQTGACPAPARPFQDQQGLQEQRLAFVVTKKGISGHTAFRGHRARVREQWRLSLIHI